MIILSNILLISGLIFILLGIYGIFRFESFYSRVLITSKVETIGFITIILGLMFRMGIHPTTGKLLLVLLLILYTNPMATHSIAKSAYVSSLKAKGGKNDL